MMHTLSVVIVLMITSALFIIPFVCVNHIQHNLDAQKFDQMKSSQQREYLIKKYLTKNEIRRLSHEGWTIAFKGFNSNMTCMNDFKYHEGATYTCEDEPILCFNGFHACLLPKDVTTYYNGIGKKYHIVFLKNVTPHDYQNRRLHRSDSKVCAKTIKIGPRMNYRYITG